MKFINTFLFVDEEDYDNGVRPHFTDYLFYSLPIIAGITVIALMILKLL